MGKHIARRLMLLVPAWLIMGIIAFTLIRLIPGDPAAVLLGPEATPDAVERLSRHLGLDKPLATQFIIWLGQIVRGEFGKSYFLAEPVLQAIVRRLPVTLSLGVAAGDKVAEPEAFLRGVEAALRRAKKTGQNRVEAAREADFN